MGCTLRSWVYPILVLEAVIVGAFLYTAVQYAGSPEDWTEVPWEITVVLAASLVIVVGGLVALGCLPPLLDPLLESWWQGSCPTGTRRGPRALWTVTVAASSSIRMPLPSLILDRCSNALLPQWNR